MYGAIYDYALSDQDVEQLFRQRIVTFDSDGVKNVIETIGDELLPGESLLTGQGLFSVDKRYLATLKEDGKFIIWDTKEERVTFEAEMNPGAIAKFTKEGNFVIQNEKGNPVWHTATSNDKPKELLIGSNGKLLAIGSDGNPFWDSSTHTTVKIPTASPTKSPTKAPTPAPTGNPTGAPTPAPTGMPTKNPTKAPTPAPTGMPTKNPTKSPTPAPTGMPTKTPTGMPTGYPTGAPTPAPTGMPTPAPTNKPTFKPTAEPTAEGDKGVARPSQRNCPMSTTEVEGDNNDIEGCGLGC